MLCFDVNQNNSVPPEIFSEFLPFNPTQRTPMNASKPNRVWLKDWVGGSFGLFWRRCFVRNGKDFLHREVATGVVVINIIITNSILAFHQPFNNITAWIEDGCGGTLVFELNDGRGDEWGTWTEKCTTNGQNYVTINWKIVRRCYFVAVFVVLHLAKFPSLRPLCGKYILLCRRIKFPL